jgi:hypothetical protein
MSQSYINLAIILSPILIMFLALVIEEVFT